MPTREQLERGEEAVQRFRERVGPRITVLWVLPDYYEDLPKPCMGGWGRSADRRRAERRGAALPRGVDDPRPRVPERARALARVDLERVGRVHALPRHGLDAGAVPLVPARAPGGGLRRLPLPGAAAHRRRRGDRSGVPVLAAPRHRRRRPRAAQTDEFTYRTTRRPASRLARRDATAPRGRDGEPRRELDEHAHAVAARPGADRVAAVVVEQRGPEHVDVRPRPLAGEALEERRGDDRIAVRPARRCCAGRRRATRAAGGSAGAAATARRGRRPRCRRRRPRRASRRRWRRRRRRGRPSRPASRRSASRGRRRASRPARARTRARRRGSAGPRRPGS